MDKIVIILGDTLTTLGALRALQPLKREGYRLLLCTSDAEENIPWYSNIPDKKITFREGVVEGLLKIADSFIGKPILVFTMDADVVEISANRDRLTRYYRFFLPDDDMVRTLMEKTRFTQFALEHGLSIPETVTLCSREELLKVDQQIRYPIIIKPYLLHAIRVNSREELEELAEDLSPLHYQAMIAQAFIEGGDDELYFCFLVFDEAGQLAQKMTARKLRQWPLRYGSTSLAVTIKDPRLDQEVEQFLKVARPAGYCSIEYKYDRITDRFYIMEPTIGRFNQQISLSVACGVNIPLALVKLIDGEAMAPRIQKDNIFWVYESNDLLAYLNSKSRYGYLKNFFRPSAEVLFSFNDPKPLFAEMKFMAKKKLRKLLNNA